MVTMLSDLSKPIELRDHQRTGVAFLLSKKRAILGDEVGLGKTFTAIEAALAAHRKLKETNTVSPVRGPRVLIVLPNHLVYQWREQLERYDKRWPYFIIERMCPEIDKDGYYIVTYNTLQNAGKAKTMWLWQRIWDVIIFDEAHRLRKHKSQQTKNAHQLAGRYVYMLTGSPMENSPADIWGLLHMCDSAKFRSFWNFADEWMLKVETPWATKLIAVKPGLEDRFHRLTSEYMLRRLKRDYLDLREPVIFDIPVAPLASVKKAHDDALKRWVLEHPDWNENKRYLAKSAGALVAKLRQFVSLQGGEDNPKVVAIRGILEDLDPQPVIIFTWYRESTEMLSRLLGEKYNVWPVHGGYTQEERADQVDAWRKSSDGILIATMKSAGEGLNLQHSSTVIFFEHDYIPTTMVQAVGRVHRVGQERDVNVYHVVMNSTVDAKVYRLARQRHSNIEIALMESVMGDFS